MRWVRSRRFFCFGLSRFHSRAFVSPCFPFPVSRRPIIRARMDAPGEGLFPFQGIVIREPVEHIERGFEQGFSDQAPVHPFTVLPVEQLYRRFQDGGSARPKYRAASSIVSRS